MPLLIDQHTGSVTYIETNARRFIFYFELADAKLGFCDLEFFAFIEKKILGMSTNKKGPFMGTFWLLLGV